MRIFPPTNVFHSIITFLTRKFCSPISVVFFLVLFLFYIGGTKLRNLKPKMVAPTIMGSKRNNTMEVEVDVEVTTTAMAVTDLAKYFVNYVNQLGQMRNSDIFGPLKDTDIVITIQVHNRIHYLQQLIESLAVNRGIGENVVIMFSHDFIEEKINGLIQSIKFCRTLQIFYPFSLQLYPNEFPGPDPNDCPAFMSKEEAVRIECNNAHNPDKYGHYREAHLSAIKHHTFWKLNYVMDVLPLTKSHPGYFLFIEEDHYVAPDLVHVIRKMAELKKRRCPQCDLMNLKIAVDEMAANYTAFGAQVQVSEWDGWLMVFNRTVWRKLHDCSHAFCTYDDYHWDWSIRHVTTVCLKQRLISMSDMTPRVFHIGQCGTHRSGNCTSDESVDTVQQIFRSSIDDLYPKKLVIKSSNPKVKVPTPYGGWGDHRDQHFCMQISNLTNW